MTYDKWWQKAVVYQIYPKSFQDSNNDGVGDIQGIINRLPYIKALGVDVIWLNPIYQTPDIDGGYDISDYQSINPQLGTMSDFESLISEAHHLDVKIIMDLVVNHTSSQHEWFQKSMVSKSATNKYRDYYVWRDPVNGHEPNNWGSFFSGPAWTYDEPTGQYYLHLFTKEQPDLNWDNPNVRESIFAMMNWWADKGIDGFRMDVISLISKPKNLPDAPVEENDTYGNPGVVVSNGPRVHQYIQEMNQKVLSKHHWMTVGETTGVTTDEAKRYASLDGNELNMLFQFEHVGYDGNSNAALGQFSGYKPTLHDIRKSLVKWQKAFAGSAWTSLYWSNHDQPRAVSWFGNKAPEFRDLSAKMLAALLHFMQGTAYIYQGEELGMTNNDNFQDISQYRDVEAINLYRTTVLEKGLATSNDMLDYLRVHSRDNARTPMQWGNQLYAGFSAHKPWLEVNPNYKTINAEAALENQNSIFYFYQQLIALRHKLPVITNGRFDLVANNETDDHIFAYTRQNSDMVLLIIANFTDKTVNRHFDLPKHYKCLIQNYHDDLLDAIRPYEVKVYQYAPNA
ncbi:alpha-glucosidase [Leuconostoc citreum]|uniref:alpha-glucosidase n=1 Tax=Leuconostoc citreum TaxID=33964 RepID=UPI002182471A|nr:alpha-glucosidase [Leuconostoc citreum]MCS8586931.1 alpha-glucosidase [Leuconostoc citreum]MCS8598636.1 alpha-glucosidase [Leuconostoc citreum]